MKKYVLVLFAAMVVACKSTGVDKDGINYKETVVINDVPKATLTFYDVYDSRCPEDAYCIWAGQANIDLLLTGVTKEGGVSEHVELCTGSCGGSRYGNIVEKTFAGQKYKFTLNEVNPFPKSGDTTRTKEQYSIKLKIEKL